MSKGLLYGLKTFVHITLILLKKHPSMSDLTLRERKGRSLLKAITYRFSATIATFSLAYLFTGNIELAGKIGILDFGIKFLIYYVNERLWSKSSWGYNFITIKKGIEHGQRSK